MSKKTLLIGLSWLLFGCGQKVEVISPKVEAITLSETHMEIRVDESNPLSVSFEPTGSSSPVIWTSSDESVATVSVVGLVSGISEGTATIEARAKRNEDAVARCTVTILPRKEPDILVSSIKLAESSIDLEVGQSFNLGEGLEVLPENAANRSVVWSTSNNKVAMVNNSGLVKAAGAGNATIVVKAADESGVFTSCVVKVTDPHQDDPDGPDDPGKDPEPDSRIQVIFDTCDNLDNFTGNEKHRSGVSVQTIGRQEGTGFIRRVTNTDPEIFVFKRAEALDTGIKDKSKGHMCFYFYIDDAEKLSGKCAVSGRVEISQSGGPSTQCLYWSSKTFLADRLMDGWNFVDLSFKDAKEINPDNVFNPAGANYFRIYFDGPAASTEFEYGIDCIGFYEE